MRGAFAGYKLIRIFPRQHAAIFALSAGYYDLLEKWDTDTAVQWNCTVVTVVFSLHSFCIFNQNCTAIVFFKAQRAKGEGKKEKTTHNKTPGV